MEKLVMFINAYILGVPDDRKEDYLRIATLFAEVAKDYGAIEISENWEAFIEDGEVTDFRKAVKAEPGEKIVMSWVAWPDQAAAIKAHEGMYNDPRMTDLGEMPFDGGRMVIGNFETLLSWRKHPY
jgi:uncharacterized protein YbaA (DUF1428 family)